MQKAQWPIKLLPENQIVSYDHLSRKMFRIARVLQTSTGGIRGTILLWYRNRVSLVIENVRCDWICPSYLITESDARKK